MLKKKTPNIIKPNPLPTFITPLFCKSSSFIRCKNKAQILIPKFSSSKQSFLQWGSILNNGYRCRSDFGSNRGGGPPISA
ncbi:hypothetical protein HanRHA438_Chr09g0414481 [Helianthus annuus]|nr:hypothetical protein HanRHA438_Chr09g0414481 [Helianthus annuus]